MPAISVDHLSKDYRVHRKEPGFAGSLRSLFSRKYETVKAVSDISFEIAEGEVVGFIGPNGAGKTTTLKCLSGLLYPSRGSVHVLGFTPFARKHAFLKQISLVMGQKNQLWWDLPALDTFLLNKEIYEIPEKRYKDTVTELSELLEVTEFLHVPVRKLSLGQRMKMELIAALLHRPRVLFLDEPTIGLDVIMQKKIREFLKIYNEEHQATILLTSHYMRDVEALCERVIVINYGNILYDGKLAELIKKHAPYKLLRVVFSKKVAKAELSTEGEVTTSENGEYRIKVKIGEVQDVAARILKHFPVEDLNIEDPDIEEVIRTVFIHEI